MRKDTQVELAELCPVSQSQAEDLRHARQNLGIIEVQSKQEKQKDWFDNFDEWIVTFFKESQSDERFKEVLQRNKPAVYEVEVSNNIPKKAPEPFFILPSGRSELLDQSPFLFDDSGRLRRKTDCENARQVCKVLFLGYSLPELCLDQEKLGAMQVDSDTKRKILVDLLARLDAKHVIGFAESYFEDKFLDKFSGIDDPNQPWSESLWRKRLAVFEDEVIYCIKEGEAKEKVDGMCECIIKYYENQNLSLDSMYQRVIFHRAEQLCYQEELREHLERKIKKYGPKRISSTSMLCKNFRFSNPSDDRGIQAIRSGEIRLTDVVHREWKWWWCVSPWKWKAYFKGYFKGWSEEDVHRKLGRDLTWMGFVFQVSMTLVFGLAKVLSAALLSFLFAFTFIEKIGVTWPVWGCISFGLALGVSNGISNLLTRLVSIWEKFGPTLPKKQAFSKEAKRWWFYPVYGLVSGFILFASLGSGFISFFGGTGGIATFFDKLFLITISSVAPWLMAVGTFLAIASALTYFTFQANSVRKDMGDVPNLFRGSWLRIVGVGVATCFVFPSAGVMFVYTIFNGTNKFFKNACGENFSDDHPLLVNMIGLTLSLATLFINTVVQVQKLIGFFTGSRFEPAKAPEDFCMTMSEKGGRQRFRTIWNQYKNLGWVSKLFLPLVMVFDMAAYGGCGTFVSSLAMLTWGFGSTFALSLPGMLICGGFSAVMIGISFAFTWASIFEKAGRMEEFFSKVPEKSSEFFTEQLLTVQDHIYALGNSVWNSLPSFRANTSNQSLMTSEAGIVGEGVKSERNSCRML